MVQRFGGFDIDNEFEGQASRLTLSRHSLVAW
jgi:hypothetical protein